MKKPIIAAAALLCAAGAHAADLQAYPNKAPIAPAYLPVTWQGLYLDFYGLYAANTTDADVAMNGANIANIAASPHGPGFGASLGYWFQLGPGGLVIGPRLDGMWANIKGDGSVSNSLSVSNATNWLGDADACLGLPLGDGKLLAYGCAGFAFGGAKPNFQVANVSQGISDTSTGWNGALGLKYQLTPNWTIGIEGDYFQLGDKTLAIPLDKEGDVLTSTTKYHMWVQKVVVGFRF
jgi:opacity protein-like surface antigen